LALTVSSTRLGRLVAGGTDENLDEGEEDRRDDGDVQQRRNDPAGVADHLGGTGGQGNHAVGDVPDAHPDEQRDHHGPDDHAERAEDVDGVQGLGPEPDHEREAQRHARLEPQPVPPGKPGAGQDTHGRGDDHGEGDDSDEHIGEAEHGTLRCLHDLAAGDPRVHVADRDVVRVLQDLQLLQHQGPGCEPADDAGDQQEPGERAVAGHRGKGPRRGGRAGTRLVHGRVAGSAGDAGHGN